MDASRIRSLPRVRARASTSGKGKAEHFEFRPQLHNLTSLAATRMLACCQESCKRAPRGRAMSAAVLCDPALKLTRIKAQIHTRSCFEIHTHIGRSEVPTQRDRPAQSASLHVSLKRAVRRVSCLTEPEIRLTETEIRLSARLPGRLIRSMETENSVSLSRGCSGLTETVLRLTETESCLIETTLLGWYLRPSYQATGGRNWIRWGRSTWLGKWGSNLRGVRARVFDQWFLNV